jgi:DNA-binding transcriptional MerR regulator
MRSRGIFSGVDIADVTKRTGLSNATLHHYEQLGLIRSVGRRGLRRQYDDTVVDVLAVIILCQRSGFTLAEIDNLLTSTDSTAWKPLATAKIAELDSKIADLERARNGLRHALECPSPNIMRCEHFRSNLDNVLAGNSSNGPEANSPTTPRPIR